MPLDLFNNDVLNLSNNTFIVFVDFNGFVLSINKILKKEKHQATFIKI